MTNDDGALLRFLTDLGRRLTAGEIHLPPCPQIALRVREVLGRRDVSADQVARLALLDPVLTGRILKLANSVAFSRAAGATIDIKTAIGRIGFDMAKTLAFEVALDSTFAPKADSRLCDLNKSIRIHSRQAAVLAYFLAKRCAPGVRPDEAMLAGLLHEVGKLYIVAQVDSYPKLFADTDQLEELFDDWHPGIGQAIVDAWELPEAVVTAVGEQGTAEFPAHAPITVLTVLTAVKDLRRACVDDRVVDIQKVLNAPALRRLDLDDDTGRLLVEQSSTMAASVG